MRLVHLNEYNIRMENAAYLPIASGLLRGFAEAQPALKSEYAFEPFLYHVDSPKNILAAYKREPEVAGFSLSMWNEQLNLFIAAEVKRRWPNCLIVVGGPQVPQKPQEYFKQHPFIDVAIRAEGEEPFSKVLARNLESRNFEGIASVSWRDANGECVWNSATNPQPKDLDMYPSPYLEGLFDEIMAEGRYQMQAIIETNRGCPFPCSFCYWGQGGLSRKYRYHGIERVRLEIEWAAKNKIKYLFNADSNFGMHQRDEEIAQILVDTKTRYGYPDKFRTCFGKNADERIHGIAKKLHAAGMEKGVTLALQSNTPAVLKAINRTNIKMSAYASLQMKFNGDNIPVYSELINGMPEENYETWKAGIETLLASGLKNQLFVYLCQVLPNTEMWDRDYQQRYGIQTQRIELNEIHGAVRSPDLVTEFEDIIVTTNAMTLEAWRSMVIFSWVTMTLHSLKVGFFVMLFLMKVCGRNATDFIERVAREESGFIGLEIQQFKAQIERFLKGQGRGKIMPEYSPIYWDEEEASFLRISERIDEFYQQLEVLLLDFLTESDVDLVREVIAYQRLRIPSFGDPALRVREFSWNLPEFFDRVITAEPVSLERKPQTMTVYTPQFADKATYAKETILWGRKSGTMMTKVEWTNTTTERAAA